MRTIHSTLISGLTGIAYLVTSARSLNAYCVLDGSFNPGGSWSSGASVLAIAAQSDGKVIFGGNFTYYGNYPNGYPFTVNNLVRFNTDGTVDTSYNPAPNGIVRAIVVQPDDKVIIGGHFTQVSGITQTYISRLTISGYPDYIGFQAAVPNSYVYALGLLSDGKVIVGGVFTTMAGFSYSRLACLKTTGGLVSTFNPGVSGSASAAVNCIAVYPTGTPSADKVLIGGDFSSVGGIGRINAARLSSVGAVDTSFNAVKDGSIYLNGPVYALATDYAAFGLSCSGGGACEKIYIGGAFTSFRNYFTRLADSGSPDNNIENSITDGAVKSIRVQSNHGVIVGGSFTHAAFTLRNGVARFYPGTEGFGLNDLLPLTDWSNCDPNGATGGTVEALALSPSGRLYAGGSFTTVEGTSRPKLARLITPAQVLDLGALPGSDSSAGYGISDTGRAAGECSSRAFRTQRNQAISMDGSGGDDLHSTLHALVPPPTNLSHTRAFAIKQTGTAQMEIVGETYDTTNWRPFWYYESDNGATKFVQLLYSGVGSALAVVPAATPGNASAVVGFVKVGGTDHAAYWSLNTTQNWLYDYGNNFFPGEASYATDTDVNRTVGYRGSAPQAFLIDGTARTLSTPSGTTGSAALGMSTTASTSKVAGYYIINGLTKPISWSYTGNGQSTYVVLSLPGDATQGSARAVNDAGDIVGSVWGGSAGEVACLWSSSGTVTVLSSIYPDLNWSFTRAYKINSSGAGRKIVGFGTHNGSQRGFVLSNWN